MGAESYYIPLVDENLGITVYEDKKIIIRRRMSRSRLPHLCVSYIEYQVRHSALIHSSSCFSSTSIIIMICEVCYL